MDDDDRLANLEQEKAASELVPAIVDVRDALDEINKTLTVINDTLQQIGTCLDR